MLRFITLLGFFTVLYSSLMFNMYGLQVEKRHYYTDKAEAQNRSAGFLQASRGAIFFTDRNDNPIQAALNKEYAFAFAIPKEIADAQEAAGRVADILGLDPEKLKILFAKNDDPYELIQRRITDDQAGALRDAHVTGVYVDSESVRFYPFGSLASQVIGFVGTSADNPLVSGRYGIESKFDDMLSGSNGHVDGDRVVEAEPGQDVVLTIDPNVQTKSEEIITKLVKQFDATSATVIVQEPKTGRIVAMGNYPTFDPNEYGKSSLQSLLNPAVQGVYEPGSVMKIVTMAAGIDSGKITPNMTYTDYGSLTIDGRTIKNWDLKALGKITMTQVIEHSVNTGAVFAMRATGRETFASYLERFGMDKATGVELPGELNGNLGNLKKNSKEINFATASFGQGVAVTPLEVINATSAIANGGTLMQPRILRDSPLTAIRQVVTRDTASAVTGMMVSAVTKAEVARIPHYSVAGKTGTAQVPDLKHGGYLNEFIHSYVGFAPASDPKFTILLKLDRPKKAQLAGATVVPAFRELTEFLLSYYNIPPDDLPHE